MSSSDNQVLKCKKLHEDATLPTRGSESAAGLDLYIVHGLTLQPGEKARVGTGIAMEIPVGMEGQIRIRSSVGWEEIIPLSDTIDADYRDEVKFQLKNLSDKPVSFDAGHRVAQIVIKRIEVLQPVEVEELSTTERKGGFGSSGK